MALVQAVRLGQSGATGGAGALSITSNSLTPSSNCLLVLSVVVINGPTGGVGGVADVRTGLVVTGGGLTWTKQLGFNGGTTAGYTASHSIWTASVASSPGAMTINVAHANNNSGTDPAHAQFSVIEYTGYNTGSPIGATASDLSTSNGAKTITLSGSPASSSIVFASRDFQSNGGDSTATPGSGWTETEDLQDSGYGSIQTQTRGSSTSSSVDWANLVDTGDTSWLTSCLALEIVVAAGGAAVVTGWQSDTPDFTPHPPRLFDNDQAFAFTSATLPPKISGMGWFQRQDRQPTPPPRFESGPAIALIPATLPPQIAGIAWSRQPEPLLKRPPVLDTAPEYTQQVQAVAAVVPQGWGSASDALPRRRPILDTAQEYTPSADVAVGLSRGWYSGSDALPPRRFIIDTSSEYVQQVIAAAAATVPQGWTSGSDVWPKQLSRPVDALAFVPLDQVAIAQNMGWVSISPVLLRRQMVAADALAFTQSAQVAAGQSLGWIMSTSPLPLTLPALRQILSNNPSAFVLIPPPPPTPISGMGWFMPSPELIKPRPVFQNFWPQYFGVPIPDGPSQPTELHNRYFFADVGRLMSR